MNNTKKPIEPLPPAACSTARLVSGTTLSKDELQAIDNLAWMVIRSNQNVGTRMKDQADSVRRIIESKKQ